MSRAETIAWACAALGLLVSAIGWIMAPAIFASAWLAALSTWLLWPLGALALILTHALTGGRWGDAAQPGLLLGLVTLPLLIPALLPVLLCLPELYHWARPDEIGHVKNGGWLNPSFFIARMALYIVVWLATGLLVLVRLRQGRSAGRFAGPALILLALSFTFASVDLTMSLEDFTSNIYGMLRAASAGLFAACIATLLAAPAAEREILADLGKLILGLVVLWTYLDFMQLLIVWQSELGSDSGWYVHRTTPYWGIVAILIEVFRFALPFLILVFPQCQRSRPIMLLVCAMLIGATILRGWWMVLPAFGRGIGIFDIACMLAFAGLAGGIACRSARKLRIGGEAVIHV